GGQAPEAVENAESGGSPPAGSSWIGTSPSVQGFITGSIMRQASAASSLVMNNIGPPFSIFWIRWAYAVNRGAVERASSSRLSARALWAIERRRQPHVRFCETDPERVGLNARPL